MSHVAQQNFFKKVKERFPEKFENCSVLDIGSLDVNGNNHFLFNNYKYVGVDVAEGKNVTVVSKGHEFTSDELFDVVISSECFEHDMFYPETIKNCIRLTKSEGLFTFTCASEGRPEHGTAKFKPEDAPLLKNFDEWFDYYKNLTELNIREVFNPEDFFSEYQFEYNPNDFDLYFWGIKK